MLERYFVFPRAVDRIRNSWIGESIERYVEHFAEQGYAAGTMHYRVPLLVRFGEFARSRGARALADLPACGEDFIADWIKTHESTRQCDKAPSRLHERDSRSGRTVLASGGSRLCRPRSRADRTCPVRRFGIGLFRYLSEERGLRPSTLWALWPSPARL